MLTDWSMNRVAGETDTVTDLEAWGEFSKCLLITLSESDASRNIEFSTKIHRGDALCVVREDVDSCLAGRIIEPHHLNVDMVKNWLSTCDQLHGSKCHPSWTQNLPDLKLVDVNTRAIVKPPARSFDYLALSYVWGRVNQ